MEKKIIQEQIKQMSDKDLAYASLESLQKIVKCMESKNPYTPTIGAASLIFGELIKRFGDKIAVK